MPRMGIVGDWLSCFSLVFKSDRREVPWPTSPQSEEHLPIWRQDSSRRHMDPGHPTSLAPCPWSPFHKNSDPEFPAGPAPGVQQGYLVQSTAGSSQADTGIQLLQVFLNPKGDSGCPHSAEGTWEPRARLEET